MTATAYRRAPLVDPAYVPLSDAAVHASGLLDRLTGQALRLVDVNRMSALDAVLATKLGGYTQAPPLPNVEAAAARLPGDASSFAQTARAAAMIAAMNRDKEGMLRVLSALRALGDAMPSMTEEQLFCAGADLLRLTVELYRRTGQRFLLRILEELRSRLPDVSGVMHMFPFQTEYRPDDAPHDAQEQAYYDRMRRLATGRWTADALGMTALLSQFSGSGRDAAAAKAGLTALTRYHGMPTGAFSADPYLAGRDPARAVELPAAAAQAEAYLDALTATGEGVMADRLEMLLENVFADLLPGDGLRALCPVNRLCGDDSCALAPEAAPEDVSALLRGLYAIRRAVWLSRDDDTVAYQLPLPGGCVTRLGGVPVRLRAEVTGVFEREIRIHVECRQAVRGAVRVRVPAYAQDARIRVIGDQGRPATAGGMVDVKRTFQNGDTICLSFRVKPRVETGYHGSASVYVGARLMALPLPEAGDEWRYALLRSLPLTAVEEEGQPRVLVTACEAPEWREKAGFVLPPPQDTAPGAAYELTLLPAAGTDGRIAAFPCVRERA